MFIVDVLRYDLEQISSILSLLNNDSCIGWRRFWLHDFSKSEIIPELGSLVRDGLVNLWEYDDSQTALIPMETGRQMPEALDDIWFELTEKGREAWDSWEDYPTEEDDR